MAILQEIYASREFVNDEYLVVTKVHYNNNFVKAGNVVLEFEASKVSVYIEAEVDGFIEYLCKDGDHIKIGELAARIHDTEIFDISSNIADHARGIPINMFEPMFSDAALNLINSTDMSKTEFHGFDLVSVYDVKERITESKDFSKSSPTITTSDVSYEELSATKRAEINNLLKEGAVTSTVCINVDVDEDSLSERKNKKYLLSIIIHELSKMLKDYKEFNAYYDDRVVYYNRVNIGLAIDIDRGLKVIKLINIEDKDVNVVENEIMKAIRKYIRNKLSIDDVSDCTFTVSDLSEEDVFFFTPLISDKQSAVLGISSFDYKLKRFTLSLTFDHRVTNGKKAGIFLRELKNAIVQAIQK